MRMVFAQHVADGAGGFFVLGQGRQAQLGHGVDNAPLHRLQPVGEAGQGAVEDDVHGIIQVSLLGEFFQGNAFVGGCCVHVWAGKG